MRNGRAQCKDLLCPGELQWLNPARPGARAEEQRCRERCQWQPWGSGTGLVWVHGRVKEGKVKEERRSPWGSARFEVAPGREAAELRCGGLQRRGREERWQCLCRMMACRGLEAQAGAEGAQIRASCEGAERKAWSSLEGGKRGLEQPARSMRGWLSLGQQGLRAASAPQRSPSWPCHCHAEHVSIKVQQEYLCEQPCTNTASLPFSFTILGTPGLIRGLHRCVCMSQVPCHCDTRTTGGYRKPPRTRLAR